MSKMNSIAKLAEKAEKKAKKRQERIEKIRTVCAEQKALTSDDTDGELKMVLREVPTDHHAYMEGNPWQLDIPGLGMTYYGKTPFNVFKSAMKGTAKDAEEDDEDEGKEPASS